MYNFIQICTSCEVQNDLQEHLRAQSLKASVVTACHSRSAGGIKIPANVKRDGAETQVALHTLLLQLCKVSFLPEGCFLQQSCSAAELLWHSKRSSSLVRGRCGN